MPLTSQRPDAPPVVDWLRLGLEDGALTEPIPGSDRIALWLPAPGARPARDWERVAPADATGTEVAPGFRATPASGVRVHVPAPSWLGRWLRTPGQRGWYLPDGRSGEQQGKIRTDLVLVWAEDPKQSPDLEARSHWPEAENVRRVGRSICVVYGVQRKAETLASPPAATAGDGCPRAEAESRVGSARAAGDPQRLAGALADLGAVCLNQSQPEPAVAALGEALALARELGDRSLEADVLGTLGMLTLAAGDPLRALEILGSALASVRRTDNRHLEAFLLERVGLAHARSGRPAEAAEAFSQALTLSRDLSLRKQQAELLWHLSVAHADLGRREQALTDAQAAVDLMEQAGNPQAAVFADHLQRYRSGESGAPVPAPVAGDARPDTGATASPADRLGGAQVDAGPGLLRMATSAAKSMARFAGAGFKTVTGTALEERLRACADCEHHTGLRCRLCGCFTGTKARMAHEECPAGRWQRRS